MLSGGADATDGIEATAVPLGPEFPKGMLAVMNNRESNFLFFRWPDSLR